MGPFLPAGAVALWLALLGGVGLAGCGGEPPPPPSVLLIVVDTLRADHLGTYGYARPTSPHIDALARTGAVFERAQSAASWTLPSMASLLTGLAPSEHGVGVVRTADGRALRRKFLGLPETVGTLAESLAARGHATAAVVTNSFMKPTFGLQRGFEHYAHQTSNADGVVDALLAWFEDRPPGPYFVLAHLMDPHIPYEAGKPARGQFTRTLTSSMTLPIKGLRHLREAAPTLAAPERAFVTAAYDEEIVFADSEIGRLLAQLRSTGELENTYVVLTSDHGEELFEHQSFEHGHSMHQEVLHVPLIVVGPGIAPRRITEPVSLIDVPATICALTGTAPGGLGGDSLLALLLGTGAALANPISEGTLYGEHQSAILAWPHKLIARPSGPLAFDLAQDPGELAPLAVGAGLEPLSAELEQRQQAQRDGAGVAREVRLTREVESELEDLGYVGNE